MSAAKHTQGPLKVVIDGTLTGVWAEVREECVDPETGATWERELCRTDTIWVRKADAYSQHGLMSLPYEEAPEQYELTEDGESLLADARLWTAAPDLLKALERAYEIMNSAREELNRLRAVAKLPPKEPAALNVAVYGAKVAIAKAREGDGA
jgi:hypothetical protein